MFADPLIILWIQLAAAVVIIVVAATFLARSADAIADKTGLGRSFIGVVMLATATSLPELGTGVSAIVLVNESDLAAGDAFGSNLFNLLIIGLLDIYWRKGPLLTFVSYTSALVGALGGLLIGLGAIAMIIHNLAVSVADWRVSPVSPLMLAGFLVAIFLVHRSERSREREIFSEDETASAATPSCEDEAAPAAAPSREDEAAPIAAPSRENEAAPAAPSYEGESLARAFAVYAVSAAVVVGAAVWLAYAADGVATEMGWAASFMGTQFLALSTSLPELAASFAALRLGAPDMAITNLLGSNIFNMGVVLFLDDLAFADGAIWAQIDEIHLLTAVVGVIMTAVAVTAILTPNDERRRRSPYSVEAAALIVLYIAASLLVFYLS